MATIETYYGEEYDTAELEKEYGPTYKTSDGTEVWLTQQAYLDGNLNEEAHYTSYGVDLSGNQYQITWEIINTETDDDSDACDWHTPIEIRCFETND